MPPGSLRIRGHIAELPSARATGSSLCWTTRFKSVIELTIPPQKVFPRIFARTKLWFKLEPVARLLSLVQQALRCGG